MWSRLSLAVLGVFWGVMCVLLWRTEYTGSRFQGVPVDPHAVWGKILTSPDSSSLAILRRNRRIGFCHLITSVADNLNRSSQTNAPEGLVRNIGHYKLDLSGSINDWGNGTRVRFDGVLTLTQDREWTDFRLQVIVQPWFFTVESERSEGLLRLMVDSPEFSIQRSLPLTDVHQQLSLFSGLLSPAALPQLEALPFPLPASVSSTNAPPVEWTASTDRLMIGNTASPVYRLQTNPVEGYVMTILVSRAGEILRIDLPGDLTLVNEALTGR